MCYWILTDDTQELITRGTCCSAENTKCPNLALDSGEKGEHQKQKSSKSSGTSKKKESKQLKDYAPPVDVSEAYTQTESGTDPFLNIKSKKGKIKSNEGFQIPNLPLTTYPNQLIDKIVLYGDQKAKVVDQVNEKEFRVNLDNGKSGIMDYAEII